MIHTIRLLGLYLTIGSVLCSCSESPTEGGLGPPFMKPIYPNAYRWSSRGPDGQTIVFSYHHITYVKTGGGWGVDPDSSGIFTINTDGTNMRMLLWGGYSYLDAPVISPDGEWLAFEYAAQIYKGRLVNGVVDTTQIVRLTNEGRNFFPAWSPDGQMIAYHNSICGSLNNPPDSSTCGVFLMDNNGLKKRRISMYSSYPTWHPFDPKILFFNRAVLSDGSVIGDSVWVYDHQTDERSFLVFLSDPNHDNRYSKYSPDGTKVGFISQPVGSLPQVWTMDTDGSNLQQLTTEGSESMGWSPDGRHIVYLHYDCLKLEPQNGVLWIMDKDGSNKRQLTFNHYTIYSDPYTLLF